MSSEMWKGFFEKLAEDAELRTEFVELAIRHGVEFPTGELSDDEMGTVAGGAGLSEIGSDAELGSTDLQNMSQRQQDTMQMMSSLSETLRATALNLIGKIG